MIEAAHADCRVSCAPYTGGTTLIFSNHRLGRLKLPPYFRIQFEVRGVGVPSTGKNNILDLVDEGGASLLSFYAAPDAYIAISYNGSEITTHQLALEINYMDEWTLVTAEVNMQGLSAPTPITGTIDFPRSRLVDSTNGLYSVYASNAIDGTAQGEIQNFIVQGNIHFVRCYWYLSDFHHFLYVIVPVAILSTLTLLIDLYLFSGITTAAPTTMPTAPPSTAAINPSICTNGCVLLSGSQPINRGSLLAHVTLPEYFKVSFGVTELYLPTSNEFRNVFALVDISSGVTTLGVDLTESRELGFTYNGTVVISNGPLIESDFIAVTTITVEVAPNQLIVYASAEGVHTAFSLPGGIVFPSDRIFAVYTSLPGVDSSGGTISSLLIAGKKYCCILTVVNLLKLLTCG